LGETTTDTLVLAASVPPVPPGSLIIDLGTGNGDAVREAALHIDGCLWAGLDMREEALGEFPRHVDPGTGSLRFFPVCCRMEDVTSLLPAGCADVVMANPPYGITSRSRSSPDPRRRVSRSGSDLLLHVFLRASAHLLREEGMLVTVNRPANLDRILTGCAAFGLAPETVQPLGRESRPASLVVVRALRSGNCVTRHLPQVTAEDYIRERARISRPV
jgi:tRNA1(Val) A37 N6-methylase TrmN6